MRRSALFVAVLGVVLATPASVLAARSWTVDANPDSLTINITTPVDLTFTNTSSSGSGIRCVMVQVPSDFEIEAASVRSINGSSGGGLLGWTATWSGGSAVAFRSGLLGGALGEGDDAVFRITGHAHTPGQWSWTADADDSAHSGTSCGSSPSYPVLTIPFQVGPVATPTPGPTPTPTPTAAPTPAATPPPTPTSAPTAGPGTTPRPTAPPTATPTVAPGTTPAPGASPVPDATSGSSLAPLGSPATSGDPPPSPGSSAAASTIPGASTGPGGGAGTGDPGGPGGLGIGGAGTEDGGGDVPIAGLDGAVAAALNGLPGGMVAWGYPMFALTVPGLLLLLAVGAQALGALAWLPLVRRRLGGFGFRAAPGQRRDA